MKLLTDFRNMRVDLRAPDHIRAEVASALRQRRQTVTRIFWQLGLTFIPRHPVSGRR
jgi:hypothetical protein